jgi:hypothetical protein
MIRVSILVAFELPSRSICRSSSTRRQKRFRPSASSNTETLQRAIDSTTSLYTVLSDVTP